ncbi:MAG: phosphomannomutase/phosphoglucomutase [Kiritimatiellaeota bacterium]|nr:phosphomannomutase/phosphoglucomutase [Kiritimatiellota bacterium]
MSSKPESVYKSYDIRGIYGATLTDRLAYLIGRAFATFLGGEGKTLVIGRDCRPHSEALFKHFSDGVRDQGFNVIDIGPVSTPMTYHAAGAFKADGAVMITASHNPPEWNGFKLCREGVVPVSGDTGIMDIKAIVESQKFAPKAKTRGTMKRKNIGAQYAAFVRGFSQLAKPLPVALDFANGMGVKEAQALPPEIVATRLFGTLDGTCPNHPANPLEPENLHDLQKTVRAGKFAFGAAFDGDADRAGFIDEKGGIIPPYLVTALIAGELLKAEKGAAILYDLRSSLVVKEVVEKRGKAMMTRVGHSHIKAHMRKEDAVFAGELSGHYYFKANHTAESAALAVLLVANIVAKSGKPLSQLIQPLRKHHHSGEINFTVARDPRQILADIKAAYSDGRVFELDGVSVEYPDWWFNIRCSNTEPLVRLNLESVKSPAHMVAKRDELKAAIACAAIVPATGKPIAKLLKALREYAG